MDIRARQLCGSEFEIWISNLSYELTFIDPLIMSYEYFTTLSKGEVPNFLEMFHTLSQRIPIELVSSSREKLLLRWSELPLKSDWPEDITIAFYKNGILVSFHMATREQRKMLLNILADQLAEIAGMPVEFEEQ